jgi:hypothetical protein
LGDKIKFSTRKERFPSSFDLMCQLKQISNKNGDKEKN